jgi:hypothetical protein
MVRRLRLEANGLGEFQTYASRDYRRMLLDAADEIERLRKERDEARRLCCEHAAMDEGGYVKHGTMLHFAESRGWDCFPQEDKPCQ